MKPLLAQSGPLDDIDVALRLIYALGKIDNGCTPISLIFSQFWHYLNEQDEAPDLPMTSAWDFGKHQ